MSMKTRIRRLLRPLLAGAAGVALAMSPVAVSVPIDTAHAAPCTDGVIPWNPYVVNCGLPPRTTPKVRGAAPDAGAIIACRHRPACLSQYVNGP